MPIALEASPVYQRFQYFGKMNPNKLALVCGETRHSYRELLVQVDALADGLAAAGLAVGEHMGVLLPNCVEFVLLLLAGARVGAVMVPQSLGLAANALENTFKAADVQHLVTWGGAAASLSAETLALASKGLRWTVGNSIPGWTPLTDVIASATKSPCYAPLLPDDLPYLLLLTSGSTGKPKPLLLSQQTKIRRAESTAELYDVTADDVVLAATPLYHSLAQRLVLMPLLSGGTCVLMEHFTPSAWIDAVRTHQASFSIAISSQLKQILARLVATGESLPSLRCLVSSSALLDSDTKKRLIAQLECEFHECYGASEIAIATNLSPDGAVHKLASVGTALPGTEIIILGDHGHPVPAGTAGEIACRTPMLCDGYYRQPAATAATLWGDFFRTGDLGRLDEDGFLYFLGRIKDIIITGGVNVYPKDIEDVVADHPAIKECAAIPLVDDKLGEVAGLVLAFNDPANPPAIRDIQRLCMQGLGDFQQPRCFFVVPELPKNALGKVDKPFLRQTYSHPLNPKPA
ncbi:MAG: class I adenylate-forming enzyme family protein [Accumulibacter sp.]|uniref:class I adenylate-forming enzyme family protein n=1 Tax=Accumulibacter sp. TaxID=2053492 RepID=UPI003315CABA